MAESGEVEVDYYAVLNVGKEVKIVFQRERKRETFDQSYKVHFISFQPNDDDLKAAYRSLQMHVMSTCKHQDPRKRR